MRPQRIRCDSINWNSPPDKEVSYCFGASFCQIQIDLAGRNPLGMGHDRYSAVAFVSPQAGCGDPIIQGVLLGTVKLGPSR